MINIGIVGCGTIAPFHVDSIRAYKDASIKGFYDIKKDRAVELADNKYHVYSSYEEMVTDADIDVIHILTPHHTHFDLAKIAIEHNKHVLLEKPATIFYNDAEMLQEISLKYNVKIAVCFQHRKDHTTNILQDYRKNETYGKLQSISGSVNWNRTKEYYQDAPWRGSMELSGGGTLINQGIHTLDLIVFMAGTVETIKGIGFNHTHPSIDVEDNAYIHMTCQNQIQATYSSTTSYGTNSLVDMEFVFEEATFRIIGDTLYQQVNDELVKTAQNKSRLGKKSYFGSGHELLIHEFYDAIQQETDNYVSLRDTLETSRIVDEFYKQVKE